METICQELGIPRRQIRETKNDADKFVITAHKTWLKCLLQHRKLTDFIVHEDLDDWSEIEQSHTWQKAYVTAHKKFNHKVIPLPKAQPVDTESSGYPFSYSQLLQYISQKNFKKLWQQAYKQYSSVRGRPSSVDQKKDDRERSVTLVAYDVVLREVITRTYGCPIVHAKLDKLTANDSFSEYDTGSFVVSESHVNLYPTVTAIETNSQIIIVFMGCIENTLYDCVSYSPAILDKLHNKPLFLIYQLFQLMKSLHDQGVLLGEITLNDIFLTENMWLHIMPRLESNLLQLDVPDADPDDDQFSFASLREPRSNSLRDYCDMWCHGQISNYDYLTILNNFAGRRIGLPGHHHIMPWVTDFTSRNGMNWRDLSKSKYRLNKGDAQLDLMFAPNGENTVSHHVSDVLSEITYYVYMARRTTKTLLCKHVRPIWVSAEYPVSIQRLQEWTPDECIPEFFSDPLVFKSIHEDLPDLEVPTWSSCPEDFITKHREALESQYVSERLHYWIDLNFGYKLAGHAAVKAKNVCLPLVDDHQTLCQRGIVQLFTQPHPPRRQSNNWLGKSPPRIYSHSDTRRRMTRSSEDLSSLASDMHLLSTSPLRKFQTSPRNRSPNIPEDVALNIERSTSYHSNVQRSHAATIILPKDYNPAAALTATENMKVFLSKTFCRTEQTKDPASKSVDFEISKSYSCPGYDEFGGNSFTNRIFSETYEANVLKNSKRLHNVNHKNLIVQNSTRNFKQIIQEKFHRELKIIGCLIVEIFLAKKLRPLIRRAENFDERIQACLNVLKCNFHHLPRCVQYPVKLLLHLDDGHRLHITDKGLPQPSPHQIVEPLLNTTLFPFPFSYHKIYMIIKSLGQFELSAKLLDFYTFFECDGNNCAAYEVLDRHRVAFSRKIAECKVKTCVAQLDDLLDPIGYEQFNPVELLLPHIIDLITNEDTSIMAAWHLFDPIATVLGVKGTQKHLLNPILKLYDAEPNDRPLLTSANKLDASVKFSTSSAFRSRKAVKLYHHSFLLRLIVRFGLRCFLDNFVVPLIEAVGGYKELEENLPFHYHENVDTKFQGHSYGLSLGETTFTSVNGETEELFAFETDNHVPAPRLDLSSTREPTLDDEDFKPVSFIESKLSGISFDEDRYSNKSFDSPHKSLVGPKSPEIAIPAASFRGKEFSTIDCEIGSKKSCDSSDFLDGAEEVRGSLTSLPKKDDTSMDQKQIRSNRISEMSSESLLWLTHRLGPVLSSRYLSRNLLKMLTLCYVGSENLLPDESADGERNLNFFSIANGRIVGDRNAAKVLDCLTAISALYGNQIVLLQYFPHISELIALCKKRITASLEGGLISSLQFFKYLIPCLNDKAIMSQLHEMILNRIIHPIIRLLGSSGCVMPNGFLARSILARKLLDAIYVLAVRIGPEMSREHLCVPAIQRFFLVFDKAYGVADHFKDDNKHEDSNFHDNCETSPQLSTNSLREQAFDEIRDVFTPNLAHSAYVSFLKYLGDSILSQSLNNLPLILNLCYENEQPDYANLASQSGRRKYSLPKSVPSQSSADTIDGVPSNSFGTSVVGNRIEVLNENSGHEMGHIEVLDLVTYKFEQINTARHLRGNWLAYWEHEIGRSEKDNRFNLKQIKLQTFSGHSSTVKSLLSLDNENSFMSGSKDKTVKLWSLRSEGDGSRISPCQYTYTNHRKSVHSLTFLESLRLTVSCDSGVHLWDPFVGAQLGQLDSVKLAPVSIVKTYPAPSALIIAGTAESSIKIIDARTFSYVNEWRLSPVQYGAVRCMAVSPSGNWIAVGLNYGQLTILDGRTGIVVVSWKATESELLQLVAPSETQLISSSLDQGVSVWNATDGSLLYQLKTTPEPAHCLINNGPEIIFATPSNRIGSHLLSSNASTHSITKLRSETFKGVLTSLALLPLNRLLLVGGDGGSISLLC